MDKSSTDKTTYKIIGFSKIAEAVQVKTKFSPKEPKKVDIKGFSDDELDHLRKHDPFLYYSIPTVKSAMVRGGEIDTLHAEAQDCRDFITCPPRLQSDQVKANMVTRSSRISFEHHPDLLLIDMLNKCCVINGSQRFV